MIFHGGIVVVERAGQARQHIAMCEPLLHAHMFSRGEKTENLTSSWGRAVSPPEEARRQGFA